MFRIAIKSLSFGAATLVVSAVGLSSTSSGAPSDMKMTEAQCATLWTEAHAGSSGDLSMSMAKPYVRNFKKADTDGDKKLSETEWDAACNLGAVQTSLANGASDGGNKTPDRTPGDSSPSRTPGAAATGAAGTGAGQTPGGTSDRTPDKN